MKKLAGSKWMMSGLIIMSILVLAGAYVGFHRVTTRADTYCAELPDAIGLFPGNPVTLRGVPIGSVNRIDNGGDIAKVTFSIDHKYALPIGAQATSIAPSVIAVRQLALIGDDLGGERLPPGRCIGRDRTSTPSSIAEALQSVNKLARELTADADPDQSAKVMASLNSISREMDGIGPIVNNLLKQLAVPARTPITGALADMATTLDHTSVLANGLADNWGTLQSLVEAVNAVTDPIVVPVVNAMTRIAYALPEILWATRSAGSG